MEAAQLTYFVSMHAQNSGAGRVEEVLSALSSASAAAGSYAHVDIAVAYASEGGVNLLERRLRESSAWPRAHKRFLVSIDFGITEPRALDLLAGLPNAEVRVPNGRTVLDSSTLRPSSTFHAKTYFFRGDDLGAPKACVVGSANLTLSALATGSEVVVRHAWAGEENTGSYEENLLVPFQTWFEEAWRLADPLANVISEYRHRFDAIEGPKSVAEETTQATNSYGADSSENEVVGALSVQLAAARGLWVGTDTLYHNRGVGHPGNQLDMPRGTRVFFGFSPAKVGKNHIFGSVDLQVTGYAPVSRSIRFGNNEMDKINLPIPLRDGPESYDHSYLIFERVTQTSYSLDVTDQEGLAARLEASVHNFSLTMNSGREYGLIF